MTAIYRIKQYQTPNLHKHFYIERDGKKLASIYGTKEGAKYALKLKKSQRRT